MVVTYYNYWAPPQRPPRRRKGEPAPLLGCACDGASPQILMMTITEIKNI